MTGQDNSSTRDKKDDSKTPSAVTNIAPVVEAIEEDDEFEEFEQCNWNDKEEDKEDAQQWQVCHENHQIIVKIFQRR